MHALYIQIYIYIVVVCDNLLSMYTYMQMYMWMYMHMNIFICSMYIYIHTKLFVLNPKKVYKPQTLLRVIASRQAFARHTDIPQLPLQKT